MVLSCCIVVAVFNFISLYYKNDKVGFLTFNLDVNQKSAECDYDPWVFYIEIVDSGRILGDIFYFNNPNSKRVSLYNKMS